MLSEAIVAELTRDVREHKGKIYRLTGTPARVTCPKCKQRDVSLDELVSVSQINVMIPKIDTCRACDGAPLETARGFCSVCSDRGWIVIGQDKTHASYVCSTCASELRGSRNNSLYTTESHAAESMPRDGRAAQRALGNDSYTKLKPMCTSCQQRYAADGRETCAGCHARHLDDVHRELKRVETLLAALAE